MTENQNNKKSDRIGIVLYSFYIVLLVISVMIAGKLVYFRYIWEPDPKIAGPLTPKVEVRLEEPVRGNILDCEGRLLAMSYPVYDIYMDCTVMKDYYAGLKDRDRGAFKEKEWMDEARSLAEGLSELFPATSADRFYSIISDGRANKRKYVSIVKGIDYTTLGKVKALPLFRKGKNRGGMIVEQRNIRKYPYGKLARRTIGFVRDNSGIRPEDIKGNPGLEGRFDAMLHGTDGRECLRITDRGKVRDFDSVYVRAVDGQDLQTTINIDLQDVADRVLHEEIDSIPDLEGACLVLMEVNSGAIRAMVNLSRDPSRGNRFEEITNYAVGRKNEPGSVFKTVTLLAALSDGHIHSLDETMPTNHGVVTLAKAISDQHIRDWEREYKTSSISILDGFKISSNYVFASLAVNNYAKNPRHFIEKIYSYGLGDSFDFDLEGLLTPTIPTPDTRYWTNSDLGTMGFGYSTEETPLHILTFYNAIAAKGRMMKPYLTSHHGPCVLNASICSRAVADTVTRALVAVTEDGTAKALKNAKCSVAGKTGTSFATFENGAYKDRDGRRKYQGTFVGFFPAEAPQYSIICCVYSKPTHRQYQGGGIPARAVKGVVNYICNTDPARQEELSRKGKLPVMTASLEMPEAATQGKATVPDLSGLGLRDALYLVENAGLRCHYTGSGHIRSQQPAAGSKVEKGTTVNITLK